MAFSGNLQGRHVNETGAKGALDVTLTPGGAAVVSFVELDVARWAFVQVDVSDDSSVDAALARVEQELAAQRELAEARPVVSRVRLVGTAPFAGQLADQARLDAEVRVIAESHSVAVERVRSQATTPVEARHLPGVQREQLDLAIAAALADPAALLTSGDLKADFDALVSEVNEKYSRRLGLDLRDDMVRRELVEEAASRLLAQADGGLL